MTGNVQLYLTGVGGALGDSLTGWARTKCGRGMGQGACKSLPLKSHGMNKGDTGAQSRFARTSSTNKIAKVEATPSAI